MQTTIHAARPTEYSGVVFKSKCEAIFARNIDLCRGLWEYEPAQRSIGSWRPDFRVVFRNLKHNQLHTFIIEYKPSAPTFTYKQELGVRFAQLWKARDDELGLLICGNPFDPIIPRTVEHFSVEGVWNEYRIGNLFWLRWAEAMNYRFDLNPT